jgi:hypothetical protein
MSKARESHVVGFTGFFRFNLDFGTSGFREFLLAPQFQFWHIPFSVSILSFLYLSSGCDKNEKFYKITIRYLSCIRVCMVGYFVKPNHIQTKIRYMDLDT